MRLVVSLNRFCVTVVEITILLSSLSSLIQGTGRRALTVTASAFIQHNYTPAFPPPKRHRASSSKTANSRSVQLFGEGTAAMVETPPVPRREEDRGKFLLSEFYRRVNILNMCSINIGNN